MKKTNKFLTIINVNYTNCQSRIIIILSKMKYEDNIWGFSSEVVNYEIEILNKWWNKKYLYIITW